ncbi:MAG: hypothetical protein ACXACA_02815 [Candidatus Ranarchaeia archaeon]|jgi:hypothetical protein
MMQEYKMPKCPLCHSESDEIVKDWNYASFHVKSINCSKCNKRFQAYFFQGKLSHIISGFAVKRSPFARKLSLRVRVTRYLRTHDLVGEKEIANALGVNEVEIIKELIKLEKKGIVKCIEPPKPMKNRKEN